MESDFTNWNSIRPTIKKEEEFSWAWKNVLWTLRAICQGEENTKAGAKKL